MAKTIIPLKVIIEFEDGAFKDGVLLYRVSKDGVVNNREYKSFAIKNLPFNKVNLTNILNAIKTHAQTIEGAV